LIPLIFDQFYLFISNPTYVKLPKQL